MFDHIMARYCPFPQSPVAFLRSVISLRRKGQSFGTSHLGCILNGELLKEKHFLVQGKLPANARITDEHEGFDVADDARITEVMEEDEGFGVTNVAKITEVKDEDVMDIDDDFVEVVGGSGWMVDDNGVIVIED